MHDEQAAWTLMACTLQGDDFKSRLASISALGSRGLIDYEENGNTLQLRYSHDVAVELRDLVEQERHCCVFLHFNLAQHSDAVVLTITAPEEAGDFAPMLHAHFIAAPKSMAPYQGQGNCHA
jgi:hypothetical protein